MMQSMGDGQSTIFKWYDRFFNTTYIILVVCSLVIFIGSVQNKDKDDFIQALASLDNSQYAHQDIDPGIREEINEIVGLFENDLKEEVKMSEELGSYYKRLGTKYLELADIYKELSLRLFPDYPEFSSPRQEEIFDKMRAIRYYDDKVFTKAYESFLRAIELDPGNPLLYYYTGVCAGWIGKSSIGTNRDIEQERWFGTAEASYERAIELDPYYVDALYGYSVLLIVELARETEGIRHLQTLLEKEKKHVNGLFLLGRAYYQIGDYDKALDEYDRILSISTSGEIRDRAAQLKEQVKDVLYDNQ